MSISPNILIYSQCLFKAFSEPLYDKVDARYLYLRPWHRSDDCPLVYESLGLSICWVLGWTWNDLQAVIITNSGIGCWAFTLRPLHRSYRYSSLFSSSGWFRSENIVSLWHPRSKTGLQLSTVGLEWMWLVEYVATISVMVHMRICWVCMWYDKWPINKVYRGGKASFSGFDINLACDSEHP